MKQGLKRFRRMATACAAGTIALSVISVLGFSGVASAAVTSPVGSSITALSAPNIAPTAINSPAGNLSFNIAAGTTWSPGSSLNVSVTDFAGNPATIKFAGAPLATANTGAGDQALCGAGVLNCIVVGAGTNTLTVFLTGSTPQTTPTVSPESLVISGIGYTTTGAATGAVKLTTTLTNFTTGPPASNAVVATPPTPTFFALNTPIIPPGATTAAGPQQILLDGNNSSWAVGDKMYVTVGRHDLLNCETAGRPDSVGFAGTPNVSVTAVAGGATATPALTATYATGAGSSCATFSGVNNVMVLTFTNAGTIIAPSASNPITITITGVKYTVSPDVGDVSAALPNTNNLGNVATGLSYNVLPTYANSGFAGSVPNDKMVTPVPSVGGAPFGPSNANININSLNITSNKPSTTINFNITASGGEVVNQPISPITIAEPNPGALSGGVTGWACIALNPGAGVGAAAEFVSTPTVAATGGGLAVGNVSLITPGGQTGPTELAFQVTTASSGAPGTVTISGISVNVPALVGFTPIAELAFGANNVADACNGANSSPPAPVSGSLYVNPVTGAHSFVIANVSARIFGQDQDATAAQAFEIPGSGPTCHAGLTPATPAVLVTNGSYQDALSASYLAGQLKTGILTTSTNTVSPEALQALAIQGVTEVFVVGGPLVVSPADITQLQNTPAYVCGTHGVTPRVNALGQPINLVVQQIFGQTADDTAEAVATFPGAGIPGTANFQGAYAGTYNDTSGSSGSPISSAPDVPVTTAILATDQSFTDAASASVVAYHGSSANGNTHGFPLLLTGPSTLSAGAAEGLANDSVQQVIVMGGPIAISDNVLTQVEAMGITVIRVAGQDFTDTSQKLAQFDMNSVDGSGKANGLDFEAPALTIARGDYYTDAIVASQVAGILTTPILLTWDPNTTGQPGGTDYLGQFLASVGQGIKDPGDPFDGSVNNLIIFGGSFAISNALQATIGHDLNG